MDTDTIKWIAGVSVPAVVAVAIFAGNRIAKRRDEIKRTQEGRLRKHFEELNGEVKDVLSDVNVSEMYGLIVTYAGGIPQYHPNVIGIELPKLPDSFKIHFPKEAEQYGNHIHNILRNNQNYKDLREKIISDFESEKITVVSVNLPPTKSPVIYDSIFWPLFSWWNDRSQGKADPHPDFDKIETTIDHDPDSLVASGWHSTAIAYAVDPTEKRKCIEIISQIAHKAGYEEEASRINRSANEILRDFRAFKGHIMGVLEEIDKLWPGTKTNKFKLEKKKCPRCKQIFS